MKKILAWPLCWLLYWIGHCAYLVMDVSPDDDDEPGPVFNAIFRIYQWSIAASCDVNDWGGLSIWVKAERSCRD